ncbi:gtp-binding protein lepa [Ceraceosorus bombacis]|uniref:Gtp-binding protein lepa n=1 Tax=Ceraceosorus bombacis TaxID=401625 RepID=A0A0P1BKQ2_9BASI|nr:gtp-binding protein lepa [Ceraceosorus bombacis]
MLPPVRGTPTGASVSLRQPTPAPSRWYASDTDQSIASASQQPPMPPPASTFSALPVTSFSIIAHIDHGKSTLADRLLELTGCIPAGPGNKQFLDTLKVERERGITVKSQAVSMVWNGCLLNLIDTPGHVDFAYEVSRSLSACQVALLVVDASQGIQSQTLSVLRIARSRNLLIIPVLNKIDLPASDPERVLDQLTELGLDVGPGGKEEAINVSAKTGAGVDKVLERLVLQARRRDEELAERQPLRALVFDSWYDSYKGVVALVAIYDGVLRKGDRVCSSATGKRYEILNAGVNSPTANSTNELRTGQVGWVMMNMKVLEEAMIGDTLHHANARVEPLEGFKPTVPMVFAAAFPLDTTDFPKLEDAITRLALNDRSVTVARESSMALGQGCRLGFLGTLHLDVFRQRLEDEYGQTILVTAPTVPFRLTTKDGKQTHLNNPTEFPEDTSKGGSYTEIAEPVVKGTLICPEEHVGPMMELCAEHRGEELDCVFDDTSYGDSREVRMVYRLPLAEIVTDFFGKLKSRSSGFAAFEYEVDGYMASDLVKLSFLINGTPVDALANVIHRSKAVAAGRDMASRLREKIPRQQFEIAIQAIVGAKVIARETVKAYRRDVTAGLYGGHYERKLKHLTKQKEGKKRLREMSFGRVQVPQDAFLSVLDTRPKAK